MNEIDNIITLLEKQYAAIGQALQTLRGVSGDSEVATKRRGRPRTDSANELPAKKKRSMSPEGRQRQIEAMKRFWAKKKAGAQKATKKTVAKATKKRGTKKASTEQAG